MTGALEKAARALHQWQFDSEGRVPLPFEDHRAEWEAGARAVLMAVREPTRPQQLALMKAVIEYPSKIHDGEVCTSAAFLERSWPMQIDAILNEEPE